MRHFITILAAILFCAPAFGQTVKALSYNTNGAVVYSGSNTLRFTNELIFGPTNGDVTTITDQGFAFSSTNTNTSTTVFTFEEAGADKLRQNARANLGLGATDSVQFADVLASSFETLLGEIQITDDAITSKANIIITNQTTASNGLLFIYRTNNEPFLGLANLIASNNTTVSNETLFRVGVAEATNKAAQFGFRSTNTNGNGVAVFSVFGFNALMMVGADASTNAVIFSGGGTNNQVMTLIKSGATEFARPVAWNNTTNAAATRTNLGLPLQALTNTSNVTTMRALAGSTNTNEPHSGVIELSDGTSGYELTFSNGILLKIIGPI